MKTLPLACKLIYRFLYVFKESLPFVQFQVAFGSDYIPSSIEQFASGLSFSRCVKLAYVLLYFYQRTKNWHQQEMYLATLRILAMVIKISPGMECMCLPSMFR